MLAAFANLKRCPRGDDLPQKLLTSTKEPIQIKNFPKMGFIGFLSGKVFKKLHFPNTLCSGGGVGGWTPFRSERGEPGGLFFLLFLDFREKFTQ